MLLYFKVRNYRSFRDEAVLDMESALSPDQEVYRIPYGSTSYLAAAAIFGKNGGGKSNLLRAMWLAVQFIRNAQRTQHENAPVPVQPFALNDYSNQEPTAFEFCYVHDGVKYVYGFSGRRSSIDEEYLKAWPNGRMTSIFSRKGQDFSFPQNNEINRKRLISEAVAPNQLFFSIACTMNYQLCIQAMRWFRECVVFSRGYTDIDEKVLEFRENEGMLQAIASAAKAADVGIADIRFEINREELDISDINSNKNIVLPDEVREIMFALQAFQDALARDGNESEVRLSHGRIKSTTVHAGIAKSGEQAPYELELRDESDGTRRLMSLAPAIEHVLENGGTWVVDELEREMHPMLVDHILKRFQSQASNPKGAQVIFTTHASELMNQEVLCRDQIFFADKDHESGCSELYSLADFSPRKDMNLQKAYLLGKFGAIPHIKET